MFFMVKMLKSALAVIVACGVLSFVLTFYSLMPVHKDNSDGNTDYIWEENSLWIKVTEGIAWGRFDANGYNNLKTVDSPDILIAGSSHMEATNVMQDESVTALLSKSLIGKYSVYNVGISGHNFYKSSQYLPDNMRRYPSCKLIFVETSNVDLKRKDVEKAIEHTVTRTPSHDKGLIGFMQRIPFFRILYQQKEHGLLKRFMPGEESKKPSGKTSNVVDFVAYDKLFAYVKSLQEENNVQVVYFYHPTEKFLKDGRVCYERGQGLQAFVTYAEKYGVGFIDLTKSFEEVYDIEHVVPHGFATGKLGTGHLNSDGHRIAAKEILKYIQQRETTVK